ncbi:MAG: hypothetical protein M1819_003658 [Sarea resinae]|nr:MAG: hypothetical protein M1819_003658 [Sarea resinae]
MAAIEASSRPSPAQQPAHPGTPPQPPSQSQFHQPSRSTSSTKSTLSALDALPPFPPPAPRSTSPRNGSPGPSAEDDARKSKEEEELEKQEEGSWLTRAMKQILITPLLTISFILSLVLIDKRTTRRLHAPTSPSPSSSSKTTSYLSFTTSSTSPGPPSQSTQKDGSAPPPNTVHAKHRKLFRMEITDAFAARDRVLVALVAVGLLALFGFGVATWWVLGWVRESVRGLSL